MYCGLCREIKTEYGQLPRLSLSNDLTFLAMLLGSLYEPGERVSLGTCILHPLTEKRFVKQKYIEYAADLNVMLTYHKCLDDWKDEKNVVSRTYGALLKSSYKKASKKRKKQKLLIESALREINHLENSEEAFPDDAGLRFGDLLGELFVYDEDIWSSTLREFGKGLGSFVYMLDAAVDYKEDLSNNSFNPFVEAGSSIEDMQSVLLTLMGQTAQAFEKLPLISDIQLMRNILYSGVWQQFYAAYPELVQEDKQGETQGKIANPQTGVSETKEAHG